MADRKRQSRARQTAEQYLCEVERTYNIRKHREDPNFNPETEHPAREEKLRALLKKHRYPRKEIEQSLSNRRIRLEIDVPPLVRPTFEVQVELERLQKLTRDVKSENRKLKKEKKVLLNWVSIMEDQNKQAAFETFGPLPEDDEEEEDKREDDAEPGTSQN